MVTVDIDTNRLFLMMDAHKRALVSVGGDASHIVETNTKLLARTIANFMPPIRETGNKGSPRLNGEAAIQRQLTSLFQESTDKTINDVGSIHGVHNVNAWITTKDGAKLNLQWDNIDPNGDRMADYHNKYRNKRGTVYVTRQDAVKNGVWKARVIVPVGMRKPYIKLIQERVGRGKCSISIVGQRLGDKYPSWITRHNSYIISSGRGIVQINLSNPAAPSILFGTRAPGCSVVIDKVKAAVKFRVKAIARGTKLILENYKEWEKLASDKGGRRQRAGEAFLAGEGSGIRPDFGN